jgi:hypothetical protein
MRVCTYSVRGAAMLQVKRRKGEGPTLTPTLSLRARERAGAGAHCEWRARSARTGCAVWAWMGLSLGNRVSARSSVGEAGGRDQAEPLRREDRSIPTVGFRLFVFHFAPRQISMTPIGHIAQREKNPEKMFGTISATAGPRERCPLSSVVVVGQRRGWIGAQRLFAAQPAGDVSKDAGVAVGRCVAEAPVFAHPSRCARLTGRPVGPGR